MRLSNNKTTMGTLCATVCAALALALFGCGGQTPSGLGGSGSTGSGSTGSGSTGSGSVQTTDGSGSQKKTVEPIDDNTTDQMFNDRMENVEIGMFCIDGDAFLIDDMYTERVSYGEEYKDGHFYKAVADITYLNGGVAGYVNYPQINSIDAVKEVSPYELGLSSIADKAYGLVLIGDYADGDLLLREMGTRAVWKDGAWVYRYDNDIELSDGRAACVREGITTDDVQEGMKQGVLSCEDYFVMPS